ncbi:MAG: hypothetical protein NVSMB47_19900 [Polyangiales bacterium]
MSDDSRRWRAGERVEDLCRACKEPREHTVIAADGDGRILRVVCGYCGSQHGFRGDAAIARAMGAGPTSRAGSSAGSSAGSTSTSRGEASIANARAIARGALPLFAERERIAPPIPVEVPEGGTMDLESLLRRIVREEAGVSAVVPADKWRNGQLVLKPGKAGVQDKSFPIDGFFHKIVMVRNRLRVLEQQINAMEIPDDQKVKLQAYITGCYGSLTSFNVLFADEDDKFSGAGD